MTNEPPTGDGRTKGRLPFDPQPFGGAARGGAILMYSLLTLGLAALAVYMAVVAGRALTSGYVAAPAIGAVWFGLRVFMILGSRKQ